MRPLHVGSEFMVLLSIILHRAMLGVPVMRVHALRRIGGHVLVSRHRDQPHRHQRNVGNARGRSELV